VNARERLKVAAFRLAYISVAAFLLLPVMVVVSTSLSPSSPATFPPEELSLKWYRGFTQDSEWLGSFLNSLTVAGATGVVATSIGLSGAYGLSSIRERRIRRSVLLSAVVPLATPLVVVAISLVVFLGRFDLVGSYTAVVLGHTVITAPLSFLITYGTLTRVNWSVREAAVDLGAKPARAFREATLPQIKSSVVVSAFVIGVLSMHEFLIALFLTDFSTRTVPVLTWITLRNRLDPTASVVATLLVVTVLAVICLAGLLLGVDRLAREL